MSQVTSDADAVSAPVADSDPTPRSAALRFGVGSLNPGPKAGRARPSPAPGSLRPCGVRVKGAAALRRRSPTRPRRFSAPGGEAFLGSPCRGSLRCAALGRHARPSGLSATSSSDGDPACARTSRAPPCRGEGLTRLSDAVRAILGDFYPASALPEGSGPERLSERLRTPLRNPDAGNLGSTRTFVPGRGAPLAPQM